MADSRRNFLAVLQSSLETKDLTAVHEHIFDPDKEEDVTACAFEAIKPIHNAMVSESEESIKTVYMDWLIRLVALGTPKEILLGLLEIIEQGNSLIRSASVIPLLQNVLFRLPTKRASSLDWTLSTLDKYIQQMPLPKDHEYENDEKKFLDLDPDVIAITTVLIHYVDLIQTFIPEVSLMLKPKHKTDDRSLLQHNVLVHYTLSVLCRPLAYMDLEAGSTKSKLRILAENCMHCLFCLEGYLFKVYEAATAIEENCKHFKADMALAVVAYLAISENVTALCPSLYNPWFLFETHVRYVILFLSEMVSLLVCKGLKLNKALLNKISPNSLKFVCLDLPEFSTLFKELFNVMILCPVKELRTLALRNFEEILYKFDAIGRAKLLITLLQGHIKQPPVQSLLLNKYKDNLHESLRTYGTQTCNPFLKANLEKVLKIAVILDPSQVETDLIENSSRLLSALNILRYVALKDKEISLGIADFLAALPQVFLEPLRKALNMSRAHYKKRMEDVETLNLSGVIKSVTVNRETLPELPADYETQICLAALTTFDLIESIVVRLEENMSETSTN